MKKFILLVSTLLFSLLLVNNKVYAQSAQDPINVPIYLRVVRFEGLEVIQTHVNTTEYYVYYTAPVSIYEPTTEADYFLINYIDVVFQKGIDINTNSYELLSKVVEQSKTRITLRVTVLKSLISDNYPTGVLPFFSQDSHLYVKFSDPAAGEYTRGYNDGYNEGYNDAYEDGYNDFNVADYFGTQNIAKDPDISFGTASLAFEPTTSIVDANKGYGAPNILLDKPYLIVIIKKNIYDYVTVLFDDYTPIYHYEATYHDIDDYDIYVFDFSDRINTKYRLEILKENVTTSEQLNKFLNDVKDNLYFSHASKLLTSSLASQFYYFGYIVGYEENISDSDAYRLGFDNGYNRGYNDGNEDGYEQGFEYGYEQGFEYGKTVEYEQGYQDGYNDGYSDGISKPFYSNFHVWIVPAIIIVVIAGIFVGYRRERYGGD